MKNKFIACAVVAFVLMTFAISNNLYAEMIWRNDISVEGSGLGAVNTLITGNTGQNTLESFGINQDGSFTPLLGGLEGGDNLAINKVLSFPNTTNFGAVVNIAETGQDLTVTLTDLYLTFKGVNGTYTAFYEGADLDLTQGTGTGIGGSGFVFALDATQLALVGALGPTVTISGGVQFEDGSTNNGPETVYVIRLEGNQVVPEPMSLLLLGLGLVGLAGVRRFRK